MERSPNPAPTRVPFNQLNQWCGLSCLSDTLKETIRMAYVFDDMAALVTVNDEFLMVGANRTGSLGQASPDFLIEDEPLSIPILQGKQVQDIAFGMERVKLTTGGRWVQGVSCFVLTADGEVFSWGNNVHGNLGQRSCSPAPALPQRIVFPREAQRIGGIAVGGGHALALSTQGQVFGWGRNISGQVGNGTRQNIPFPVSVHLPDDARPVRKVACGSSHSLALAADGRVFAWGENGRGQLGTGQEGGFCLTPKLVILPPNSASIKTICCGKKHSLALSVTGQPLCWGSNKHGELGLALADEELDLEQAPPTLMSAPEGPVLDIGAASALAASVCSTAENVFMWGKLTEQKGYPVDAPWQTFCTGISEIFSSFVAPPIMSFPLWPAEETVRVHQDLMKWSGLKWLPPAFLQNLRMAFVCGIGFVQTVFMVSRDDDVYFVGHNIHGSAGTGVVRTFETRQPTRSGVLSGKGIKSFSFGLDVTSGNMCLYALTKYGVIYAWGYNEVGELGLGYLTPFEASKVVTPKRVEGILANKKISQVCVGSDHILAIGEDGELYSWGYNFYGQCGTGSRENEVLLPARVRFPKSAKRPFQVISASAGMFHSVCCTDNRQVFAWGSNNLDQLGQSGNNKPQDSSTPLRVMFPPDVFIREVVCGPDCTLALSTLGHLYFWGTSESARNSAVTPVRVCVELGQIKSVGTAHWAKLFACETVEGRVFVWGELRGERTAVDSPRRERRAKSVMDAFAMFSNPPAMIQPLHIH